MNRASLIHEVVRSPQRARIRFAVVLLVAQGQRAITAAIDAPDLHIGFAVASLDPVLAHSILGHLEQLNREEHITILCSLHFLDLVHRYASRVIALKDGRLMFDGPAQDIDRARFDHPLKLERYGELLKQHADLPGLLGLLGI